MFSPIPFFFQGKDSSKKEANIIRRKLNLKFSLWDVFLNEENSVEFFHFKIMQNSSIVNFYFMLIIKIIKRFIIFIEKKSV